MALIIDIDEYKKQIPNYDPIRASDYHIESAKLADEAFDQAVKNKQYSEFIFLCGGSASGKSEFVSSFLYNTNAVVFDSTLSSNKGVKTKLSKCKKFNTTVIFIQPSSLLTSFITFKNRERKFHYSRFIETHSGSRQSFLFILEKYKSIKCKYFISDINVQGVMTYEEIIDTRENLISKIRNEQLDLEVIAAIIKPFI